MATSGRVEITVKGKDDGASATLAKIGKAGEDMGKKLDKAGKLMLGAGIGIVAALGGAAKAAEDERVNVERLSAVLDNVGVSYDNVKDSLEAVILATQRKTGIADDQQRDALSELILATGDYQKALDMLPLALDFAAAKQMDVATSAELLGKVAAGNISMLTRYGIVLDEDATAAEALAAVQDKVTGSAEKMASPLDVLKASFSDMVESIGGAVLPVFKEFTEKATVIIDKISEWAGKNPEVLKTLLAIGAALAIGGAILMGLSSLSKAIIAINTAMTIMHALSGPAGWAKLAAGIAIAGASIIAVNKLMKQGEVSLTDAENKAMYEQVMSGSMSSQDFIKAGGKVPGSYASGGTVPGPLGKPVPIIAHGGEKFLGAQGQGGGGGVTLQVGTLMGDESSLRSLARKLKQIMGEDDRRNAFGQVNSGYFYGRSAI